MRISLVPDGVYESYRQITPELLQSKGICLLLPKARPGRMRRCGNGSTGFGLRASG